MRSILNPEVCEIARHVVLQEQHRLTGSKRICILSETPVRDGTLAVAFLVSNETSEVMIGHFEISRDSLAFAFARGSCQEAIASFDDW